MTPMVLVLGPVALLMASASLAQEGKPRIAVVWTDYELLSGKLPSGARKAIERETQSIFGEAGIDASFHHEGDEMSSGYRVRVVLVPRSGEGFRLPGAAMGAILERAPSRGTVYVFVPVVERAIGISLDSREMLHDGRKTHALARALARVLAHEVVHAIDSDIPHGPEGSVMEENLTGQHLLGHRLSLHETTVSRLLDRLSRPSENAPPREAR
jgi:hypothetical protein